MMRTYLPILFFACACMCATAQTPYDSFAPETSRPILEIEALSQLHTPSEQSQDTILCALVIDTSQEQVYFIDDIRKWMSVDPLADKYPNISPYAYCGWNPVNAIDPDGRDIWELDETGTIVNKIKDENQDAFRMNGKEISFAYGSVKESQQDSKQTSFTFGNEDVAANAFKYMADHSPVEYGLINTNSESTIITQHNRSEISFDVVDVMNKGSVITSIFHSHPGNTGPSGLKDGTGDMQSLRAMEEKLGYQIAAFVYLPKSSSLWMFTGTEQGGISNFGNYYPKTGVQSNQSPSLQYHIKHILGIRQ